MDDGPYVVVAALGALVLSCVVAMLLSALIR